MRRFSLLILVLFFFSSKASADILAVDKVEIRKNISSIEQSLENGDSSGIVSRLSPNALPSLRNEIEDSLGDKKIHFNETNISDWISVSSSTIRVNGSFSASGPNWKMNGLGNYFVFEKVEGRWLLLDTDFYQKFSSKYWGEILRTVFTFVLPVFIITFSFWIWMLVDCLNRPIKDKLVWVLILIFLNFLGAILYFFIERKKVQNDMNKLSS